MGVLIPTLADPSQALVLSWNDSMGSVVLAASSSARASLFTRYGPSIGPRLALALSCERNRDAIPFLPTEAFRLSLAAWSQPKLPLVVSSQLSRMGSILG